MPDLMPPVAPPPAQGISAVTPLPQPPAVDKAGLLAAIAAAGSQGATDYKAAQTALTSSRQGAIQAALSSSIAQAAPQGMGDYLSGIIGQPYASRDTQLTANAGTDASYYGSLSSAADTYATEQNKLPAMIETNYQNDLAKQRAQYEADKAAYLAKQAAAEASRSSRGGGGGGGGGGGSDDWYGTLRDRFGVLSLIPPGIMGEVNALGYNSKTTGLPRYLAAQQYAQQQYGVPAGVAAKWFPPSDFAQRVDDQLTAAKKAGIQPKQFIQDLKKEASQTQGNQDYWVAYYKDLAKKKLKKK